MDVTVPAPSPPVPSVSRVAIGGPAKLITIEAILDRNSRAKEESVEKVLIAYFQTTVTACIDKAGAFDVNTLPHDISRHISSVSVILNEELFTFPIIVAVEKYPLDVFVYRLSEEEVSQEEDASGEVAKYQLQPLPHRDFHGLWEHLVYDADIKNDLLNYVYTAMLFSEKKVNPHVIGWNRVVLLHGPPGTGKTSLCKALAHKLSLRLRHSYLSYDLVEVNAHSLFSKWFSESGKLVMKMFADIRELAQEPEHFVCILVDEVESLTAARAKAMQGSEPSDSIRVVNAVLTELDKMKSFPNVLVLTTSNITGAIDEAFLDRADIVQYIGPPGLLARYDILASCVTELFSKGLIASSLAPLADGAIPDGNSTSTPILPVNVLLKIFDQANHSQNAFSSASILNAVDETSRKSVLINFLPLMLDYARIRSVAVLASTKLLQSALKLEGLSGRALRKLPFVAASVVLKGAISSLEQFVDSLAVAGAYVSARKQQ